VLGGRVSAAACRPTVQPREDGRPCMAVGLLPRLCLKPYWRSRRWYACPQPGTGRTVSAQL